MGACRALASRGVSTFGSATYQPTREFENVYHFIENLSLIKGRNTIKIGVEWKPIVNFSILQPPYPRGTFSFNGNNTRDANNRNATGLGFADFALGIPSNASIASFINDTFQQPGYFFYVQDDVKVTKQTDVEPGNPVRVHLDAQGTPGRGGELQRRHGHSGHSRWSKRSAASQFLPRGGRKPQRAAAIGPAGSQ